MRYMPYNLLSENPLLNLNIKGNIQSRVVTSLITSSWLKWFLFTQITTSFQSLSQIEVNMYKTWILKISGNCSVFRPLTIFQAEISVYPEDGSWATHRTRHYLFPRCAIKKVAEVWQCHNLTYFSTWWRLQWRYGRVEHNLYNYMMASPNGNIFRVIRPLRGVSTGQRWIPLTKTSDVELWYFKRLSKQRRGWDVIAFIVASL